MGHLSALDMAQHAPLDTAISWHLSSNHYPPVPAAFAATCIAAIEAADDLDWNRSIKLPRGCNTCRTLLPFTDDLTAHAGHDIVEDAVLWKDREEGEAPAGELVESFHLHAFLGATLEDDEDDVDLGEEYTAN